MPKPKVDPNPVIKKVSADGKDLVLEYTMPNGDRVVGEYTLAGWGYPPSKIAKRINAALARPPRAMLGARGARR